MFISELRHASEIPVPSGPIVTGQGEYIVFSKASESTLSFETYEKIYAIFNEYSPLRIARKSEDPANRTALHCFERITEKLQALNPDLEIAFVPRTLYELVFIRKCIREDIKHNITCAFSEPIEHFNLRLTESLFPLFAPSRLKEKCWHLACFEDEGDTAHLGVVKAAYKLNRTLVKLLSPSNKGLRFEQLKSYTDKEIAFFKDYTERKLDPAFRADVLKGPSICFNSSFFHREFGLCIYSDEHTTVIHNALRLDCSTLAQENLFLYRGSKFESDSPCREDSPYSLSYGTSLWAGCIYDEGATAFRFMKSSPEFFATPVPFSQVDSSPFYVPTGNTLTQLYGRGEMFHPRTKAWKNYNPNDLQGIITGSFGGTVNRDCLKSDLTKEDLIQKFEHYKQHAIRLR